MKCVMEKSVLQLLLPEQKEHRAAGANDLAQTTPDEPDFLNKVITRGESWVYGYEYDLETKTQSSQWRSPGSPRPKKVQQSRSKIKTMLTAFFDWEGVVHHEYVPPGQTINKEYHLNGLQLLRDAIGGKWSQLWATGDWQLHRDNASAPASCLTEFFAKHHIIQVTQLPYSPDLAPCDFWLSPKLKSALKGKKSLHTVDEVRENTMGQLMVIPTKDFAECFEQWKRCWENCGRSQGAYFEGD